MSKFPPLTQEIDWLCRYRCFFEASLIYYFVAQGKGLESTDRYLQPVTQKTAMANQGRRATLAELTEPLLANPVDSDDPYGKIN